MEEQAKSRLEIERNNDMEEGEITEMEDLKAIPTWKNQISFRGLVASLAIGIMYSVIVMKLNLTTGLVPTLNVSAALLAFVLLRSWTKLLHKAGIVSKPFTRQENTVVQTCAVACYSIALGGGFGSYLLGLNKKTYELAGADTAGNEAGSYKEPGIGWMTGFLFAVCFVGLLTLVPLRKIMIIDYKLTYPSGTASAVLINGFHTTKGDKMAKKQVRGFVKYFTFSFLWSFFQWFFSAGDTCGFSQFPTFGLQAFKQRAINKTLNLIHPYPAAVSNDIGRRRLLLVANTCSSHCYLYFHHCHQPPPPLSVVASPFISRSATVSLRDFPSEDKIQPLLLLFSIVANFPSCDYLLYVGEDLGYLLLPASFFGGAVPFCQSVTPQHFPALCIAVAATVSFFA